MPGSPRRVICVSLAMSALLPLYPQKPTFLVGYGMSQKCSSFRDCAGNVSNFPREITETALAHVIGDKAEQAYRRSDALEKRRKLMEAWAAYCEPKASTNVVQIRKR